MIQMDNVNVESIGSWNVIEVTFKHKRKWRNEGFQYYISSKFYSMFARYLEKIFQDTVAAGNLQFLKEWNKIGKRRVKNTSKINVNIFLFAVCNILNKKRMDTPVIAGGVLQQQALLTQEVSIINLKQNGQWVSDRMVEGSITNSLPIRLDSLNYLLPMEETEEVGQVNSKNNNQAIERFDLYVDVSNNSNISVAPLADNRELTLYGFSQFNVLDMWNWKYGRD